MRRLSVLAFVALFAIGMTYVLAMAQPAAGVAKSFCDCVACSCPDCTGEFCGCGPCVCDANGCALAPVSLDRSCCAVAPAATASVNGCDCEVCDCPECDGEVCTCDVSTACVCTE